MKAFLMVLAWMLVASVGDAWGAQGAADLGGAWQGRLQVQGAPPLTIRFDFTRRPDGSYGAVLNSPDNGAIKNVAANSVTFDGSSVKVEVPTLQGSYTGTVRDGRIAGQWTQPTGPLPLDLTRYEAPALSKAQVDQLTGDWMGPLKVANMTVTMVLRLKPDGKGGMQGTVLQKETGGVEVPLSDVAVDGDKVTVKIARANAEISGTHANGTMTMKFKQPSPAIPNEGLDLVLKKGTYQAQVYPLALNAEAFGKLRGTWTGKLNSLNVAIRIDSDAQSRIVGFMDSPDQGANGIPIAEAALTGDQLVAKVPAVGGELRATLAGNELKGTWTQGPQTHQISLVRK